MKVRPARWRTRRPVTAGGTPSRPSLVRDVEEGPLRGHRGPALDQEAAAPRSCGPPAHRLRGVETIEPGPAEGERPVPGNRRRPLPGRETGCTSKSSRASSSVPASGRGRARTKSARMIRAPAGRSERSTRMTLPPGTPVASATAIAQREVATSARPGEDAPARISREPRSSCRPPFPAPGAGHGPHRSPVRVAAVGPRQMRMLVEPEGVLLQGAFVDLDAQPGPRGQAGSTAPAARSSPETPQRSLSLSCGMHSIQVKLLVAAARCTVAAVHTGPIGLWGIRSM